MFCILIPNMLAIEPDEIIANSKLYKQFLSLPKPLQEDTLKTLSRIPKLDVKYINLDDSGQIYYQEPTIAEHEHPHLIQDLHVQYVERSQPVKNLRHIPEVPQEINEYPIPLSSLPKWHSRPNSKNILYLDFDGEIISGRAWNSGANINCLPYDTNGNSADLSADEIFAIRDIYERVVEDFIIWDIDVTTERPHVFNQTTAHLMITIGDTNTPAGTTAGGIAYLNVFGDTYYNFYSPAFVYYNRLNQNPKYIAEAASHEVGHNLGLSHDGTSTIAYYTGHGSGPTSWAPIMGVGYYRAVTQWSKGEYANANNLEDDITIITEKLGRAENFPGVWKSGNRTDCNLSQIGYGIVRYTYEYSVWLVNITVLSNVEVKVKTYQSVWSQNMIYKGNNLDVSMMVIKDLTAIAMLQPQQTADVTYNSELTPGNYMFAVGASGDASVPYTNYGSLGQYTIELCVKHSC